MTQDKCPALSSIEVPAQGGYSAPVAPWNAPLAQALAETTDDRHVKSLAYTIDHEVIPRLVLACRSLKSTNKKNGTPWQPLSREVPILADLLIADGAQAQARVEHLRTHGVRVEDLCLKLFAPTARLLGQRWETDEASFVDVTIALGRLQHLLHAVSARSGTSARLHEPEGRILLGTAVGEQHSFGIIMVSEFFRRAGWEVTTFTPLTDARLTAAVRREAFDLVGLSLSVTGSVDALTQTIASVRRATRNRKMGVLVGGPAFLKLPELVGEVGADATAQDGLDAVDQARRVRHLLAS